MILNIDRLIDKYIGNLLILALQPIKLIKKFIKPKDKKIAIIKLWTLGESLLTLPSIKKLKDQGYKVDVIVTNRSSKVYELSGLADNVINFSPLLITKLFHYDYVIDFEPYFNLSALISFYLGKKNIGYNNLFRKNLYDYKIDYDDKIHTTINMAKLLKPLSIDFVPKELVPLKYTNKEKKKIDNLLSKLKFKKLIGIHTGLAETSKYRMWKIDNVERLIKKILNSKKDTIIILTGTNADQEINNKIIKKINNPRLINLSGKTNVEELSYLMTKFNVFISNDTGPMHLAAAMKTKTIGLFGPNLPERFAPFGKNNISIYKANKLKCSPCINVHKGEFRKCPYNGKCMDLITVDDVYKEI